MSVFTPIRHWVFGLNATEKAQLKCASLGLPYEMRDFWPPAHDIYKLPVIIRNHLICPDLYRAEIGDAKPVFWTEGEEHFYEVLGTYYPPGGDHIVSPKEFHIRYHHSEAQQK